MKTKKDRIFVIVLAIVAGNLAYQTLSLAIGITAGWWKSPYLWMLVIANAVALAGVLWLLRAYRRSRKIAKTEDKSQDSKKENS